MFNFIHFLPNLLSSLLKLLDLHLIIVNLLLVLLHPPNDVILQRETCVHPRTFWLQLISSNNFSTSPKPTKTSCFRGEFCQRFLLQPTNLDCAVRRKREAPQRTFSSFTLNNSIKTTFVWTDVDRYLHERYPASR